MDRDTTQGSSLRNPLLTNGLHILTPLVWFGGMVLVANMYGRQLGLIGQPFINIDKWTQGRLFLILATAFVWAIVLGITIFAQTAKPRPMIASIIIWNVAIVVTAVFCVI
ncbi:hypothetical protein OAG71_00510 [bacterium]|nr:hypothetical protein [bacterium]